MSLSASTDESDLDDLIRVGSGVTPDDLVVKDGRAIEEGRAYCPHGECSWWVPVGRENLAERHVCPALEDVYETPDDLLDADDMNAKEYLAHFVDSGVDWNALYEDMIPRPRSERIRLLFDFELFDFQRAIADDPSSDKSINCGRQVGKTETGGAIIADAILFSAILTGHDAMFAGDVKDTAVEMFRRCTSHFEKSPLSKDEFGVKDDNKTKWEFDNDEKSRILTGTLQNGGDTERGVLPKVIVVDEATLIKRSAFEDVVEPMFATHGDDHELFVVSTPRGKSGYHYDANQPSHTPDYFSPHSVPTSANPLVDSTFLHKKRNSTDTLSWRQEWLGEFVERGNAYLPTEIVRQCINDCTGSHPRDGVNYYAGVDVARKGNDRTVYIVLAENGALAYIDSEEKSTVTGILDEIERLHGRFDFVSVSIDENAVGGGVVDLGAHSLENVIKPYTFSAKSKQKLYRRLKTDFEDEELEIPSHSRLIKETTSLTYDFTKNGILQVSHPENGQDDFPDALALGNHGRTTHTPGNPYAYSFD